MGRRNGRNGRRRLANRLADTGTILSDLHLRTMSQLLDLMPTSIDAYSSPALSISLLQEVPLPRDTSRIIFLTLASVS